VKPASVSVARSSPIGTRLTFAQVDGLEHGDEEHPVIFPALRRMTARFAERPIATFSRLSACLWGAAWR
jgi:hypothetical protein